jgi:hypothetical protein
VGRLLVSGHRSCVASPYRGGKAAVSPPALRPLDLGRSRSSARGAPTRANAGAAYAKGAGGRGLPKAPQAQVGREAVAHLDGARERSRGQERVNVELLA